jgi:DNA-binding response OmpR family regulator
MKILLIEDDLEMSATIQNKLTDYFVVETVTTGEEGEFEAQVNSYDLIILDYTLPDINGLEVCKRIRNGDVNTPILMLTGQVDLEKKVIALDAGVDDYVTKPFHFEELMARVRALMRRQSDVHSNILQVNDLTFDLHKKIVKRKNKTISLRRKELYLLEYLMRNTGRVITREMILDHVWDSATDVAGNVVDVHIKYLRDLIDKPFNKKLIKTIHGLGYKIEA